MCLRGRLPAYNSICDQVQQVGDASCNVNMDKFDGIPISKVIMRIREWGARELLAHDLLSQAVQRDKDCSWKLVQLQTASTFRCSAHMHFSVQTGPHGLLLILLQLSHNVYKEIDCLGDNSLNLARTFSIFLLRFLASLI